ncbi:Zn-dependent exopeptidase [Cryphonectria parasitica EP155]|uniref:Zn-dependent exopeptidase n=1 Tax=Cryphonectria parasitica (strain ATCC 38755 / EP155) TaxID=660469 RepID=A0A9P4Y5R1_CRYP1|nr:Zn-dependent exopeptidase [Cryphonectria parasitica EP155]KAF3766857.1 Zn-dependent exopeptidase [Cryphonectria parasitica EP155]
MAPKDNQPYDPAPPIPTYDEAIAGGSHQPTRRPSLSSPYDDPSNLEFESQSLLNHGAPFHPANDAPPSSTRPLRRPGGYRPPTVETDDEYSDSEDGGEEDHVRREMQELEIDDDASTRSSIWTKRMPFSLSLPRWKSWRWRLPSLPSIRLGEQQQDGSSGESPGSRRRCTPDMNSTATFIMVGRVFAILLIMGFLYLLFMSDLFSNMARRLGGGQMFDPESVRIHVQGSVDKDRIRENLKHFTSYAHVAGSEGDYALAMDTKNLFVKYGLEDVTVDEYYVYLNYPKPDGRAVQILDGSGKPTWTAQLEEGDPGEEKVGHQTFAFHGHSKSGDVKGPLIYANYGSREDFKRLYDSGIDTKGAIALVKYYGTEGDRALKIKAAELAGFAGCIIYSDPKDDGFLRGDVAPNGRFMPSDGVQRGGVSLMSWVVGDVLTPGWESKQGLPRMKPEQTTGLVQIPSLPLAWRDAQVLLQHIKGFGQPCPDEWVGGVPDVGEWWTGNLSGPIVRLKNEQDENTQQPIWNVYGRIVGVEQPDKSIIIGNHRDAWSYGATDPGSGSAIMLEMVRIFGDLVERGWRPQRTIEFMSWDAEEYNLIGSTEFVENNLDGLRRDGYVYINIDTPIAGDEFHASGSPVFQKILYRVIDRVYDPIHNTTLRELWDRRGAEIEGLGAGSDYVAFQDIAGVSSLDLFFDEPGGPFHPYHSNYDNFEWMDTVGDPGFTYHGMMAELLGLLILELSDRPLLPFDMAAYANALYKWTNELSDWTDHKGANQDGQTPLDLNVLKKAVLEVIEAVASFQDWEHIWQNSVLAANGWEPIRLGSKRCEFNNIMSQFETGLLDVEQGGGIPNRTQFRHVVFGPQLWSGYDEAFFPAIRDVVESGNWTLANLTVAKTARIIRDATVPLKTWQG